MESGSARNRADDAAGGEEASGVTGKRPSAAASRSTGSSPSRRVGRKSHVVSRWIEGSRSASGAALRVRA
jgi:hypothetical protein